MNKRMNERNANSLFIRKKRETIENLKYQIKRYKAMGNGVKCQSLNNELSKLLSL